MKKGPETLFIPPALALPLTYATYLFKAMQTAANKSAYRQSHFGLGSTRSLVEPTCSELLSVRQHTGADRSSIAQELICNLCEPLSRLWPIKTTQAKQQGRCSSSRPKDSHAMLSSLCSWPAHVENCCSRGLETRKREREREDDYERESERERTHTKPFLFVKIITAQRLETRIRIQVTAWTSLPLLSPSAVDCAVALALRRILPNNPGFVETICEQRSTFVAHQVLIEGWGGLKCCCFN